MNYKQFRIIHVMRTELLTHPVEEVCMYMSCDQTQSLLYILLRIPMVRQEGDSEFQTAGRSRGWDRGGTLVL